MGERAQQSAQALQPPLDLRARTWAVHGGRCSKPPGCCSTSRREGPAGADPWPGRRAARGPPALAWLTIAPQLAEVGRGALPAADDDGRVAVPAGRLQSPSPSWVFGGTPARRLRGGGLPAPTLGLPCSSSRRRSRAGVRLTPLSGRAPLPGCLSAHREPDRAGGDVRRAARTVLLGHRFLWTGSMRSPQSPLCGVAPGCPRGVVVVVPVEPPSCWRPRAHASSLRSRQEAAVWPVAGALHAARCDLSVSSGDLCDQDRGRAVAFRHRDRPAAGPVDTRALRLAAGEVPASPAW